LYAGVIACFIKNWKALEPIQQARFPLIFAFIIVTLILILNSSSGSQLNTSYYHPHDTWSLWGGYLTGLFVGMIMMPSARRAASHVNSYEKLIMKIGAIFTVIFFSIVLPLYFTIYTPPSHP
jgi:hypothetical protein